MDVHDPWASPNEALQEFGLNLIITPEPTTYDAVILAIAHDSFRNAGATALRSYGYKRHIFYDLKSVFACDESDSRL